MDQLTAMTARAHASAPGRAPHLLHAPGFLVAVALLALNDAVLKGAFGNALTGKLSDVAGLAAFALFLTAWWPARRTALHVGVAVCFALFKTPLADAPLAAWNALDVWPLTRVVDLSDWLALAVLPASWWYAPRARPVAWLRVWRPAIVLGSSAAFLATSRPTRAAIDGITVDVPYTPAEWRAALGTLETRSKANADAARRGSFWVSPDTPRSAVDTVRVFVPGPPDDGYYEIELRPLGRDRSLLRLLSTTLHEEDDASLDSLRAAFRREVLEPARAVLAESRRP